MKRATVSMRVAFVLRSTEVLALFRRFVLGRTGCPRVLSASPLSSRTQAKIRLSATQKGWAAKRAGAVVAVVAVVAAVVVEVVCVRAADCCMKWAAKRAVVVAVVAVVVVVVW